MKETCAKPSIVRSAEFFSDEEYERFEVLRILGLVVHF